MTYMAGLKAWSNHYLIMASGRGAPQLSYVGQFLGYDTCHARLVPELHLLSGTIMAER